MECFPGRVQLATSTLPSEILSWDKATILRDIQLHVRSTFHDFCTLFTAMRQRDKKKLPLPKLQSLRKKSWFVDPKRTILSGWRLAAVALTRDSFQPKFMFIMNSILRRGFEGNNKNFAWSCRSFDIDFVIGTIVSRILWQKKKHRPVQ